MRSSGRRLLDDAFHAQYLTSSHAPPNWYGDGTTISSPRQDRKPSPSFSTASASHLSPTVVPGAKGALIQPSSPPLTLFAPISYHPSSSSSSPPSSSASTTSSLDLPSFLDLTPCPCRERSEIADVKYVRTFTISHLKLDNIQACRKMGSTDGTACPWKGQGQGRPALCSALHTHACLVQCIVFFWFGGLAGSDGPGVYCIERLPVTRSAISISPHFPLRLPLPRRPPPPPPILPHLISHPAFLIVARLEGAGELCHPRSAICLLHPSLFLASIPPSLLLMTTNPDDRVCFL